jgi:thioesterase domain-containing protein
VLKSPTIEGLAAVLSDLKAAPGEKTLSSVCRVIPLRPQGTRPPFICLGASPLFLPLARLLGPDQPFHAVDLTELKKVKLPSPCKLEDIAAYVVEGIREFQPKGPYSIGGWCLYGMLAYEAALQLLAQGHEVELLTLIDTPNVAYRRGLSAVGQMQMRAQKGLYHLTNLAKARPAEMVRYSMARIKAKYGVLKLRKRLSVEMALQEADLRLMDIDPILFNAATTYQPPPYPGRALVVQAAETPAGHHWQLDVQWRNTILGKSVVHCVAGGHEGMFKYPYVETLAAKMKPSFEQLGNASKSKHNGGHPSDLRARPSNANGSATPEKKVKEPAVR